jgi:hypothetical protein
MYGQVPRRWLCESIEPCNRLCSHSRANIRLTAYAAVTRHRTGRYYQIDYFTIVTYCLLCLGLGTLLLAVTGIVTLGIRLLGLCSQTKR